MNDEEALIARIVENRKDEAPRLIYADLLQEHGNPWHIVVRRSPKSGRDEAELDDWLWETRQYVTEGKKAVEFGFHASLTRGVISEEWRAVFEPHWCGGVGVPSFVCVVTTPEAFELAEFCSYRLSDRLRFMDETPVVYDGAEKLRQSQLQSTGALRAALRREGII